MLGPDGVTTVSADVTLAGRSQTTAGDGAFEFGDLTLGAYTLNAAVGGRLRATLGGLI